MERMGFSRVTVQGAQGQQEFLLCEAMLDPLYLAAAVQALDTPVEIPVPLGRARWEEHAGKSLREALRGFAKSGGVFQGTPLGTVLQKSTSRVLEVKR